MNCNSPARLTSAAFFLLALLCDPGSRMQSQSKTYYVDVSGGNDSNGGRTAADAWQSLVKVNGTIFQPGDSVLFRSGSSWKGQLAPKGSGSEGKPVVVAAYGGLPKPVIDGNGMTGTGVVYLYNQEYWEINGLEIINSADTGADRRGVYIAAANFGIIHHIYLKNLLIHDIKGLAGDNDKEKRTAGIGIETTADGVTPTRFDDILIEGCTIHTVDNTGIYTDNKVSGARSEYPQTGKWPQRKFTNVRIRNNVIHHIAKNAMIIRFLEGGVVEHNVCYETALKTTGNTMFTSTCDGTVFQFNEGYYNRSTGADGSMYDADLRSPNTIWQYSYSHDNAHGLFWTCTDQADSNVICRYNISRNDRGIIFCINYPNTFVSIYNNTVYCGNGTAPVIISERNNGGSTGSTRSYSFQNNVIINKSPDATFDFRSAGYSRFIDHNTFYGFHGTNEPDDANKLTSNPMLVAEDAGGTGFESLTGFALRQNSPCISSGAVVPDNGGRDFWGIAVSASLAPDRGASAYQNPVGALEHALPAGFFQLMQNYPNPFNPSTVIRYQVLDEGDVSLKVYDLLGHEVATLVRGTMAPGSYSVIFDSTGLASGTYYYELRASEQRTGRTMLVLK